MQDKSPTMQAVAFSEYGDAGVLSVQQLPLPVAGKGQVLVKVAASAINPTDLLMRSGQQAALMKALTPPYVCGFEFSGVIAQTGPDVSRLAVGQKAMGITNARNPLGGAHAEYVLLSADSVVALPANANMMEAAMLPLNGLTVHAALQLLQLKPGQALLITGGAGAVAGYAIQMAKNLGLQVVADCFPAEAERLLKLGAAHVVSRGANMAAETRALFPSGVDGLLDCALIGDAAAALVRDGGKVVSLRRTSIISDSRVSSLYLNAFEHLHDTPALQGLAQLLEAKKISPRIATLIPYTQAVHAHQLAERKGLNGRVVLVFDSSL